MAKSVNIDNIEFTWCGQSAFKIIYRETVIYIDPFNISSGDKADMILITHDHHDHCDPTSIARIQKKYSLMIAPKACEDKLRGGDVRLVKEGDTFLEMGIEIKAVPAYNNDKDFHPRGEGVGYVLKFNDKKVYHAGDTDLIPEMKKLLSKPLGPIDVALLPVGGTYTMDAREAAEAVDAIKPKNAIPMHYGSIVGSMEDSETFEKFVGDTSKVIILK